jgi:hypothetical protein
MLVFFPRLSGELLFCWLPFDIRDLRNVTEVVECLSRIWELASKQDGLGRESGGLFDFPDLSLVELPLGL